MTLKQKTKEKKETNIMHIRATSQEACKDHHLNILGGQYLNNQYSFYMNPYIFCNTLQT